MISWTPLTYLQGLLLSRARKEVAVSHPGELCLLVASNRNQTQPNFGRNGKVSVHLSEGLEWLEAEI